MRLHILSDLHLEFAYFEPPETGADLVILAGDTAPGKKGLQWAQKVFEPTTVIYLAGNHEYYHYAYPKLCDDLTYRSVNTNVFFLENKAIELGDIRILGCTLWTDFRLFNRPEYSMLVAAEGMNDYRLIRRSPQYSKIRPADTVLIHHKSRIWLEQELKKQDKKNIVITHHAPSQRSIPHLFSGNPLNPAYASDLEEMIRQYQPALWIHGHMHMPAQYRIGETMVVCNPRGYPEQFDNGFDPGLVIEV